MGNPKLLNLDDLETQSDITIKHEGVDHKMRLLEVGAFIEHQKRAKEQEKRIAEAEGQEVEDMGDLVTMIRDSILEFFPTLPINDLPVAKLFAIFGWLNEVSAQINEISAPTTGEGVTSTEGKEESRS